MNTDSSRTAKDGRRINHNRRLKHDPGNDPSAIYSRLPPIAGWGGLDAKTNKHLFEYYKGGPELYPYRKYSRADLVNFLLNRERVKTPSEVRPPERKLTLWIQNTPAQVNDRYQANASSSKCRWEGCPAPGGTILKGFLRIAFDEHPDKTASGEADPFHNAGYIHLYCFEELFDLGFLVHYSEVLFGFSILPDTRHFPHETRNPMALTRDHEDLIEAFIQWKNLEYSRATEIARFVQDRQIDKKLDNTKLMEAKKVRIGEQRQPPLWSVLTNKHLSLEVKGRRETRERRGGANIDKHRGDLRSYLELKYGMKKRRREEESDDDEVEEFIPDQHQHPPPQPGASASRSHGDKQPPPPPTAEEQEEEFIIDQTWMNAQQPPQERLHQLHSHVQDGPMTRKRSRATERCINHVLTSPQHLTRRSRQEIQELLEREPQHIRDRVLAGAPEYAGPLLYDDHLEERVGRLGKRQRRDVSEYTGRRESLRDPRKLHSE